MQGKCSVKKHSLTKQERLSSRNDIQELFDKGSSFCIYPIRVRYIQKMDKVFSGNSVMVSVPKRHYKRAVDRNLLKRRIRESYRLNKELLSDVIIPMNVTFMYVGKQIYSFDFIQEKLILVLNRLRDEQND